MAEVYLARKRGPMDFVKLVVVKRIHPHLAEQDEFIKMFLREGRISALLKHPKIVDIYDLGQADNTYFLAMEYLAGQTLARVIPVGTRMRRPMSPLDSARIIADAADGLHAAHTLRDMEGNPKPVIHRDVSPGNIMVLHNGGVKLLDFGIAKARGEITSVGGPTLKGKTGYVSPEQIEGDAVDPRSDIFALGIVLWEALCGRRLFREPDDTATLDAILTRTIRPPSQLRPEVPGTLDTICLRALEKDPENRFQSAREMRIELENMLWTQNYNREDDSIAHYMNDVFADEILAHQKLVRATLARVSDRDEPPAEKANASPRRAPRAPTPAGKNGRLPLPAPNQTGEVPILSAATAAGPLGVARPASGKRGQTTPPPSLKARTDKPAPPKLPDDDLDIDVDDEEEEDDEPTTVQSPVEVIEALNDDESDAAEEVPPPTEEKPKPAAKPAAASSGSGSVDAAEADAKPTEPAPAIRQAALARSDATPVPMPVGAVARAATQAGSKKRWPLIVGGCAALALVIVIVMNLGGGNGDDKVAKSSKPPAASGVGKHTSNAKRTNDTKTAKVVAPKVDDSKTDDGKTDDTRSDDGKTDDTRSDDTRSDDGKTDDGKTDDGKTDDTRSDTPKTGHTKTTPKRPKKQPRHVRVKPKRDPQKARALFIRGARAYTRGQFSSAERLYRAAINADPRIAMPYKGLGLLYKSQGNKPRAVRYLKQYLRHAPHAGDAANIKRIIKSLGG